MAEDHNDEILAAIAERIKAQGDNAALDLSKSGRLLVEKLLNEKIQAHEASDTSEEGLPRLSAEEETDVEAVAEAFAAEIEAAVDEIDGLELENLSDDEIDALVDALVAAKQTAA